MKNKLKLWHIVTVNFIICYTLTAFIMWDFTWIENLSTTTSLNRFYFFMVIILKLIIDVMLFNFFTEEKKDKQKLLNEEAESYSDKRGLEEYNNSKKR
jgi:hypothetical protein